MKISEITIKYARKVNLGNYQTMDLEVTLTGSVEGDPEVETKELFLMARELVKEQAELILEGKK